MLSGSRRSFVAVGGVAMACALLVVEGGCDSDRSPSPAPGSPVLTAPATDSVMGDSIGSAGDRALRAYRGMWAAYEKAGERADPDEPDLPTYATGDALQTLTNGLRSVRERGLVIKGDIVLAPRVTAVEPAERPKSIEITDCADDSRSLLYRRSGELFNDRPGGRRLIVATVTDSGGGVWKVESFGAHPVGSC
jgi:hypothetical protein